MQNINKTKILLVIDEPYILEFLEIGLNNEGFKVQAIRDGRAALSVAKEFQPHIVILDLERSEINEVEVCAQLKKDYGSIIIMLTGRDEVSDHDNDFNAEVDDYLAKPFSFKELLKKIYTKLDNQFPGKTKEMVQSIISYLDRTFTPVPNMDSFYFLPKKIS